MKNTIQKKFFKLFSFLGISSVIGLTLTSCSTNEPSLIFANFESYMSPELQQRLQQNPNLRNLHFDSYSSNESMMSNFKNGTYTIGVPSTYALVELIKKNQLLKLDWSRFGLKNPYNNNQLITTAKEALDLFIKPVQDILIYSDAEVKDINLLDYCVPYFFQSYVFAYRGEIIPELSGATQPTVTKILDYIGSPEGQKRFRSRNGFEKLGAVEDERSLFSMAHIVKTSNQPNKVTVNPEDKNTIPTIDDYLKIYENLSNPNRINAQTLGKEPQPIFLNSDSSVVLNKLAMNSLNGAFMFNGDAIFAAQGGENNQGNLPTGQDFHIVTPKFTSYSLDSMVINNEAISRSPSNLDKAYDVIKQVGLEGVDLDLQSFMKQDANDEYKYGPMLNFSFVQYTSPLRIISGTQPQVQSVVNGGNYFDSADPILTAEILKAYNIEAPEGAEIIDLVEAPLTAWQKQAIVNAYARFKNSMWS